MFNKFNICCLLAALALVGCESEKGEEHEGHEGHHSKYAAEAKLSETDARAIVMTKVPDAKIKEGELEKEHGKLIWSFDLAKPNAEDVSEINIDAITGEVVAMEKVDKD